MAAYFSSLDLSALVSRLPAGIAQGVIWGIMALGVYMTFRLLNFADMTVDGTFTTGGAVTVMPVGLVSLVELVGADKSLVEENLLATRVNLSLFQINGCKAQT